MLGAPQVTISGGGGGGGGAGGTSVSDYLAAMLVMSPLHNYILASVTLGAGTWLIMGKANMEASKTFQGRLWLSLSDKLTNITVLVSTACASVAYVSQPLKVEAIVTPTASTTYYLKARDESGTIAVAATTGTGTNKTLTGILAVKIA